MVLNCKQGTEKNSSFRLLTLATKGKNRVLLKELLLHKDLKPAFKRDALALFESAVSSGCLELAEWFIKKGALEQNFTLGLQGEYTGRHLIFEAAANGQNAMIKLFISYGVDVNLKDDYAGDRPLHYAARNGKLDTMNFLKELGADESIEAVRCDGSFRWYSSADTLYELFVERRGCGYSIKGAKH